MRGPGRYEGKYCEGVKAGVGRMIKASGEVGAPRALSRSALCSLSLFALSLLSLSRSLAALSLLHSPALTHTLTLSHTLSHAHAHTPSFRKRPLLSGIGQSHNYAHDSGANTDPE
eukprot:2581056-Rhodomonas_salina.4